MDLPDDWPKMSLAELAVMGDARELTKTEKDFLNALNNKVAQLTAQLKQYPLRDNYPTAAAWAVYGWVDDLITAIKTALEETVKHSSLHLYASRINALSRNVTETWEGTPTIKEYRIKMVQAGAATASPKPMVSFPDKNFIPTLLQKLKDVDVFGRKLMYLWILSAGMDSQPMIAELAAGLNRVFKEVASKVADVGKSIVVGTAKATGSIVGAFMKSLWKPAAVITAAVLVYKKLDRAEIGPFKGPDDGTVRRRR